MKIGFVGAGGTGKSTTAKLLAERLKLPLIESPSRGVFKKHGVTTEDAQNAMTAEQRYALQEDIFKAIDQQASTIHEGVFERTPLDNFYYLLFRCHDSVKLENIKFMAQRTVEGLLSYHKVVYFPIYWNWPDIGDGMRTSHPAPRILCDYFVRGFLVKNNIQYLAMQDYSPDNRVDYIRRQMGVVL